MIKIEEIYTTGWEPAILGMRNPKNSWDDSDTDFSCLVDGVSDGGIGEKDLHLMQTLADAGSDHGKFLRFIQCYCDITAPLYWWKEFDTYRMGVEKNSCSTMHKIQSKEFTYADFSISELEADSQYVMADVVDMLNKQRELYNNGGKYKGNWWQMIQLLPSSYNQKRTVMMSYAALRNMYHARKNHKLDEWREFCRWIEALPYSELITGGK